jgi:hypothetical protein
MKKTILQTAVAGVLTAAVVVPAQAAVNSFNWSGNFTMLDAGGSALANTSITTKGANQYQTAVSGTMQFDTVSGAGTATVVPFDFFSGTLPAEAVGINMQAIGDGVGGAGTLVLGNMLFNWNGTNGIPVSIVLDAAGFFAGELTSGGANSATPASDGTYINPTWGYLGVGPVPIATTAWNTTDNCTSGVDCMGNGVNGILPLIYDTAPNNAYDGINTGGTIGGSPMLDGPFAGSNANFDVTSMTFVSSDPEGSLPPNCDFGINCGPPEVPVPAAVWLFGSGLLGLVGVARRKKVIS